jgi:hypothetical protein
MPITTLNHRTAAVSASPIGLVTKVDGANGHAEKEKRAIAARFC